MAQVSTLPAPSAEGHASACSRATPPRTVTGGSEGRAPSVLDHTEHPDSRCSAPLANSVSRSDVYRCSLPGGKHAISMSLFQCLIFSSPNCTAKAGPPPLPRCRGHEAISILLQREVKNLGDRFSKKLLWTFIIFFFFQKKIKSS